MSAGVVNVMKWLKDNEDQFVPPVCNKMMSDDYIKIMFVGGPNTRKDFHLDHGEEFFYMVKGDMLLKVMERGEPKDIHIRQGEVFRLPPRIPHSPQRFENTLGLVIERKRINENEHDGLRYFCDDGKTILWQKFFILKNLGEDLPPVFKEYFSSEQYKTGKPIPGTTGNEFGDEPSQFIVDKTTILPDPFALEPWIERNLSEINNGGKCIVKEGELEVTAFGAGSHNLNLKYESWYWHKKGHAQIESQGSIHELNDEDAMILPAMANVTLNVTPGGYGILFIIDAFGNLPQGMH